MDTPHLELMRRAMLTYSWRSKALASNIANLDTPGYRRMAVDFETRLQEARASLKSGEAGLNVMPRPEVLEGPAVLEDELMEMADTQMRNQLTTRALREHFGLIRTGITGRTG